MILILGYGNPLRSDDGVGCVLAHLLQERLNRADVQVHLLHQLTPELVTLIAGASVVIFIDAREGENTGSIVCEPVHPQIHNGIFTHNTNPSGLLSAASDWYGAAPHGLLISVAGASFEYGDKLSPELTALLPTVLNQVERLIESYLSTPKE